MSLKSLTIGVAAVSLVGAAAAGVTSIASAPTTPSPAITPVVFGAPLPLDPATDQLTGEFTGILNQLQNPGVKFKEKAYLVEGGLGPIESRTADRLLNNASQQGKLPLAFSLTPPVVSADGATATTTVTATSPAGTPASQLVTFINSNGWKLSKSSATAIIQAALASG